MFDLFQFSGLRGSDSWKQDHHPHYPHQHHPPPLWRRGKSTLQLFKPVQTLGDQTPSFVEVQVGSSWTRDPERKGFILRFHSGIWCVSHCQARRLVSDAFICIYLKCVSIAAVFVFSPRKANTHSSTHRLKACRRIGPAQKTVHTPCYYYASGPFKLKSSLVFLFDFPRSLAPSVSPAMFLKLACWT